ncbi:hypothetical protein Dimus_034071 [Dionaea muscipula]
MSQKHGSHRRDSEKMIGGRGTPPAAAAAAKKTQMDLSSQRRAWEMRELHLVRKNIREIDENRRSTETLKAEAELELLEANKTSKDLALQIEESNFKTSKGGNAPGKMENHNHAEVVGELLSTKQELSKLKLRIAHALEEKSLAEKEAEASIARTQSYLKSSEELTKEIEDANEELVLVELARIEAIKELAVLEAKRKEEHQTFSSSIEEKRKKISSLMKEIGRVKQLEAGLVAMNSEIQVLQNELDFIREMETMANISHNNSHSSETGDEEGTHDSSSLAELDAVEHELEALKNELVSKKKELEHTSEEIARLKKRELKVEEVIEKLHSKLLRAKDKLEAAKASEATARAILSTMSATWDQLKTGAATAKDERERTLAETESIKRELEEIDSQVEFAEDQVEAAIQELEEVKFSESVTLEKLKVVTDNVMRARASATRSSSVINISKFEYEYLRGCAASAKEIANRKVEAAEACVEALKMSEKEMLMRIEIYQRELGELSLKEKQELHRTEKPPRIKELVDTELQGKRETIPEQSVMESSRKPIKVHRSLAHKRMSKHRKSTTQVRHTRHGGGGGGN